MKLKAPPRVGDPCVAGVGIAPRNGVYEVEAEIGAVLVECFGFIAIETAPKPSAAATLSPRRARAIAKKS
jgi:hypothetical protein